MKVLLVAYYAYRLLFLGGNFRGARHFQGNPYLNSTAVLFDMESRF